MTIQTLSSESMLGLQEDAIGIEKERAPLLVCCEPLRICKSLIFPYLENNMETSASATFFGSIPMKSLCSGEK